MWKTKIRLKHKCLFGDNCEKSKTTCINISFNAFKKHGKYHVYHFGTIFGDYKEFFKLLKKDKRVEHIEIEGRTFFVVEKRAKKEIPGMYITPEIIYFKPVYVNPEGSVLFGGKYKPYLQQGTGLSFRAENYNPNVIDEKIKVGDEDAFRTTRELARREGILVGGSSGGVVYVATQKAKELHNKANKLEDRIINIVAILPNHGNRYLTTVFSDKWLKERGIELKNYNP